MTDESPSQTDLHVGKLLSEYAAVLRELDQGLEDGRNSVVGRSWTHTVPGTRCVFDVSLTLRIRVAENGSTEGNTDLDQGIPGLERVDGVKDGGESGSEALRDQATDDVRGDVAQRTEGEAGDGRDDGGQSVG